jgi:dTDP-4-dehydrorhamnose reductase
MKNVLVTGGKGQLATSLKGISKDAKSFNFIYVAVEDLDITKPKVVNDFFKQNSISYCINCAAYTAVDQAESNEELAKSVNIEGPRNLAKACKEHKAILLQISTDFVFDGSQALFYTEESNELPLSVYGATKLKGEKAVAKVLKEHFIIRTAWLYSEYGNNFVKTMLKLGSERDELSVVCDQIGTPTYTKGLAKILIEIISIQSKSYGVYHYSNEGVASWYDFAVAIFELSKLNVNVIPIKSIYYKTAAERPKFSVMDKSKIKEMLGVQIPHWRESLNECLNLI